MYITYTYACLNSSYPYIYIYLYIRVCLYTQFEQSPLFAHQGMNEGMLNDVSLLHMFQKSEMSHFDALRSTWEFPTIGGPNMDPKIVGLLIYGLPKRGP